MTNAIDELENHLRAWIQCRYVEDGDADEEGLAPTLQQHLHPREEREVWLERLRSQLPSALLPELDYYIGLDAPAGRLVVWDMPGSGFIIAFMADSGCADCEGTYEFFDRDNKFLCGNFWGSIAPLITPNLAMSEYGLWRARVKDALG
jgi:hypothetical protein